MASMAQIEERFKCAVDVIQSLPKKGSFQPSNDMLLRFYSLFKQANNGPCTGPRPAFWDPIGRAKYDAWHSLGNMPKHEAMESYTEELKKIVEVMPQTEEVESFTRTLGRFYELVDAEKPPVLDRAVKSANRTPSPIRASAAAVLGTPIGGSQINPASTSQGHVSRRAASIEQETSDSDDGGNDTADDEQYADCSTVGIAFQPTRQMSPTASSQNVPMSVVLSSLDRLQTQVSDMTQRLSNIERSLHDLLNQQQNNRQQIAVQPRGATMGSLPPFVRQLLRYRSLILFLLPIIAGFLLARRFMLLRRR